MNKLSLKLFLTLLIFVLSKGEDEDGLHLKQVIILSRHNVRETFASDVDRYTPNEWPALTTEPGYLTRKGAILEGYMGEYFCKWFEEEGLFDECPTEEEVYVHANRRQRTVATADCFVKSAFENCDIPVHHRDIDTIDPIFEAVPISNLVSRKDDIIHEMQRKLNDAELTNAFEELNDILNISHSDICKIDSICNLAEEKNEFVYRSGEEPDVIGPLNIGNAVMDRFITSYYNGLPLNEIAWGHLMTVEKWKLLSEINIQYINILFNTTESAKNMVGPLLNYMFQIFKYNRAKFVLLVGHDSNIISVINVMGFKSVAFPHQHEVVPIGGKLVFQKWANTTNEYLKVEFVYQSWEQVRHGIKLYLGNPPIRVLMELNNCKTDQNGLCLWKKFISGLKFY